MGETPGNDGGLVRQAHKLTADLATPNRAIYWIDLILTATATWGGLWIAATAHRPGVAVAAGLVGLLALYRGLSFIHEISHLRPKDVPGFRLGWNLLIGVPLMTPSMMYEGVHNLHHAKHRFGTAKRSGIPAAGAAIRRSSWACSRRSRCWRSRWASSCARGS